MKTLVILSVMRFQDNDSAGVARTKNYAYALANSGVKVIFASFLEYDSTAILKKDKNNSNIYYYGSVNANNQYTYKSHKKRIIGFLKSILSLVKDSDNMSFLLYPSSYVTFDMAVLFYLKKVKDKRVFYEVNEVRKYSVSFLSEKIKINYLKHSLNERLAKYYDGLICISTNIQKYYSKYNSRSILIPILSDLRDVDPNYLMKYDGLVFNIGFAGSISIKKENFNIFFDALSKVIKKDYNIVLNLYGSVSNDELNELNELLEQKNITKNVIYHGKVRQNEIVDILKQQQLLVLPRRETLQNKYGFSTKLSEYIVSGTPVLLTDVSDNLKYLKDGKDVIVVDAENSDDFALRIMQLIDNYNEIAPILSKNAIKSAKIYFDYMLYKEKLTDFLFNDYKK